MRQSRETHTGLQDSKCNQWEAEIRYAEKSMISESGVTHKLLNDRYSVAIDMGEHDARLELKVSRLEKLGSSIKKSMKVGILLSSLVN